MELDLATNKPSANTDDTYLQGKYKSQIYRYDKNNLCLYFPTGKNASNIILPQLDQLGIKHELFVESETEQVYIVSEKFINQLHSILKFSIKGKNIQAKSVKTARKLAKQKERLEKKQAKLDENKNI